MYIKVFVFFHRDTDREVPSRHAHVVAGLVLSMGDARAGRRAPA